MTPPFLKQLSILLILLTLQKSEPFFWKFWKLKFSPFIKGEGGVGVGVQATKQFYSSFLSEASKQENMQIMQVARIKLWLC